MRGLAEDQGQWEQGKVVTLEAMGSLVDLGDRFIRLILLGGVVRLLGWLDDPDGSLLRWGKGLVASEGVSTLQFEELAI